MKVMLYVQGRGTRWVVTTRMSVEQAVAMCEDGAEVYEVIAQWPKWVPRVLVRPYVAVQQAWEWLTHTK